MMSDLKQQEHYTQYPKEFEPIEIIKGWLTPEEYKGYLKGNILKYVGRYRFKNGVQDLEKALVYAEWLQEFIHNPYQQNSRNPLQVARYWFTELTQTVGEKLLMTFRVEDNPYTVKRIKDLIELVKKEQGDVK